ncbi:MAG TPA: RhuM family protein [Bacteroidales bacterium]|nr:DNA-binding protein [Bacteroidales bacterium]HNV95537.1 RhuM family protein [Bacteroidales bacterium]
MKNEIVVYQDAENAINVEVLVESETLWLTQQQIVELFQSSKANISEHIKNIFKTKELDKNSTVRKIRTVQKEGNRMVSRDIKYYNLDITISIGYRVNSIRGTQFRIWANRILKEYLLRGYAVNQRMERLENKVNNIDQRVSEIDLKINAQLPPRQGVFFDGQVFDAHVFVSEIIKSAKKSIILIDNYIDESVLMLLSKRTKNVSAIVYTKAITKQLELDLKKHNQQYPLIEIKTYTQSHDRFLIIDRIIVYHMGASLKDLGKRWFAFSRLEIDANMLLEKLS